jgi:sugar (pentulose or hexulose) kinase
MSKEYLIVIDLGTTLAKCAIYDAGGAVLAEAQEAMRIRYPSGGRAGRRGFLYGLLRAHPAVPADRAP